MMIFFLVGGITKRASSMAYKVGDKWSYGVLFEMAEIT